MDPAHIARLKEEQELAYNDTQANITQWKKFDDDYTALQDRLKTLPEKVTHDVMVPFGSLAFMPGQIIHSNEIMVLLGDNWFAERSAKQACEIIDRRKKQIDATLEELEEQKRLLGDRLGFTSEFQAESENKEGIVDIQEEYDPEQERLWREERKRKKQQEATKPKHLGTPAISHQPAKADNANSKSTSPKSSSKHKDIKRKDASVKLHQKNNDTSRPDTKRSGQTAKVAPKDARNESKDVNKVEGKTKVSSGEEMLWARLDELEKQEEEMDELARLSDYEEDEDQEEQPMFSFAQEAAPEEHRTKKPSKQLKRTDSTDKRVQWKDQQDSGSSCTSSDDEDVVISTIHFTHTKTDEQQETKTSGSNELTSPADIYNQYVAMQPFAEERHRSEILSAPATSATASASSAAEVQSAQSPSLKSIMKAARPPPSPEPIKEKQPKQILPQLDSVFSGNIVERKNVTLPTQPDNQPMAEEPPKRVSKFKAARQQQRR